MGGLTSKMYVCVISAKLCQFLLAEFLGGPSLEPRQPKAADWKDCEAIFKAQISCTIFMRVFFLTHSVQKCKSVHEGRFG